MTYDWLVVGAGYAGCTFAERVATQLNQKVLIVDKRNHIGGNAYDYYNDQGILIHKYGPHIFHTYSTKVWDYLSQFTEWTPYEHHVLAEVDGQNIPVPFNLNSLHQVYPKEQAHHLEKLLIENYGLEVKVPILKLRENSNSELKNLAEFIYQKIFYGYTKKQWDLTPEELDASVTGRVPVFISRDNRYFQDTFQAMPKLGYTEMFKKMVGHKNIEILLNTNYRKIINELKFNKIFYSGPIDEYFDYMHGPLPYRSLRFDMQTHNQKLYQETGQINFPNNHDYTRIAEFKYLTGQNHPKTTIAVEYPEAYVLEKNDPYYPIPKEENKLVYKKYLKESEKLNNFVIFAGRLADYQYYNMDQVVGRTLNVFEQKSLKNTNYTK